MAAQSLTPLRIVELELWLERARADVRRIPTALTRGVGKDGERQVVLDGKWLIGYRIDQTFDGEEWRYLHYLHDMGLRLPEYRDRASVGLKANDGAGRLEVRLHCFFYRIPETPEMLERLRRPEPKEQEKDGTARSKIGSTNLKTLTPIDRVAVRVAPTEKAG